MSETALGDVNVIIRAGIDQLKADFESALSLARNYDNEFKKIVGKTSVGGLSAICFEFGS